ncbi:hypothetical protein K6320_09920, partial [Streptococcus suis]|nr:hypothetical protein [Streptococcus suis]MBY6296442.1 hypothetical protein [Streptococcus suis]
EMENEQLLIGIARFFICERLVFAQPRFCMQKTPTTWSGFSGDYEKYLGLGVGQNSNNHREFPSLPNSSSS